MRGGPNRRCAPFADSHYLSGIESTFWGDTKRWLRPLFVNRWSAEFSSARRWPHISLRQVTWRVGYVDGVVSGLVCLETGQVRFFGFTQLKDPSCWLHLIAMPKLDPAASNFYSVSWQVISVITGCKGAFLYPSWGLHNFFYLHWWRKRKPGSVADDVRKLYSSRRLHSTGLCTVYWDSVALQALLSRSHMVDILSWADRGRYHFCLRQSL